MPSTGIALAPSSTRAVIGPVLTQAGFQYWYFVCSPDCIVAVRQGIWTGLMLAVPPIGATYHLGLVGVLFGFLMKGFAEKQRKKVEAQVASIPTSRLRSKPNLVYPTTDLRSIALKSSNFGPLVTPDIILETKTGARQKYGIQKPDFDKACEQLKQMYPELCKL